MLLLYREPVILHARGSSNTASEVFVVVSGRSNQNCLSSGFNVLSRIKSAHVSQSHVSPLFSILAAFLLFVVLKLFAIDTLRIEGHSMEPALAPGRLIFVNRLAYGLLVPFTDEYIVSWSRPGRNSIIVLKNPLDGSKLVKRCIAIPGDTIRIEDGTLAVGPATGRKIDIGETPFFLTHGDTLVPEDKFLVLGDNLDESVDSRLFGFVEFDKITGNVLF